MKKKVCVIVLCLIIIKTFGFTSFAAFSQDNLFEDTRDKLFSAIDSETADVLEAIGFDISDPESLGRFSLKSIFDYFSDDFKTKLKSIIKHTLMLSSVIFITSLFTLPYNKSNGDLIEFITVCIVIIAGFSKVSSLIKASASVISLSSDFLLGYIPVFAALIAMSGNVTTALSYNSLLLTVAEICSGILSAFSERVTGLYFALVIGFSLNRNVNLSRFVSSFSKFTSLVIGAVASMFTAFLTVKSVFSVNIDTVSAKGVRFLLSSVIPVVGSAISDAYSTLLGSIGVVKGSVAITGIAASLIINLPVLFEGMCFCLSYNFLSFTAEALNSDRISSVLKAVSTGIKFLLLIQLFIMFIIVVSTAVMVSFRTSV